MNRQDKIAVVESLHNDFANSKAAFVVGYKGLTVAQLSALRSQLRKQGGTFKVAKARLMKRAVQGLECLEELQPSLRDQVGLVFAQQEAPVIAKVLYEFAKENQALHLISGCMDSAVIDNQMITRIASLPSREVLLAMVCGTLKAPIQKLAGVLAAYKDKVAAPSAPEQSVAAQEQPAAAQQEEPQPEQASSEEKKSE